ncbi:hypothetical protein GJ496_007440 [Pomphorhynchus laevis]|nr:hypothetical protein GJ496_007440 [Pomphorhynchus laevis]
MSDNEYEWVESDKKVDSDRKIAPVIKGPTMPPPGALHSNNDNDDRPSSSWINRDDLDGLFSINRKESKSSNRQISNQQSKEHTMQILKSRELNKRIDHEKEFNDNVFEKPSSIDGYAAQLEAREYSNNSDSSDSERSIKEKQSKQLSRNDANHRAADRLRTMLAKLKKSCKSDNRGHQEVQKRSRNTDEKRLTSYGKSKHSNRYTRKQLAGISRAYENEYETSTLDLMRQTSVPDWSSTRNFVGESDCKIQKMSEPCYLCDAFSGEKNPDRVMISTDNEVSVFIDSRCSLIKHQCFISIQDHVPVLLQASRDSYSNCTALMQKLTDRFELLDLHCVFVECSDIRRKHTVIHCYPLSSEEFSLAPFHFKKAIQDSEGDWSDNKKFIEFPFEHFRHKIPSKLPYFMVSFKLQKTQAHIIENRLDYSNYFEKDVLAGILNLERHQWYRKKANVNLIEERVFFDTLLE